MHGSSRDSCIRHHVRGKRNKHSRIIHGFCISGRSIATSAMTLPPAHLLGPIDLLMPLIPAASLVNNIGQLHLSMTCLQQAKTCSSAWATAESVVVS